MLVKPISKADAIEICKDHPHAGVLPMGTKYSFAAFIDNKVAGLASWGYGVVPKITPKSMFGEAGLVKDYLELGRFFVYDWCPPNTASCFLSFTQRLLKRYTKVKYLYTYAAGFQGLVGTIYQAANYDYIGKKECRFLYVPKIGLIHPVSLWARYNIIGWNVMAMGKDYDKVKKIFPEAKLWCGDNFTYIYWLRGRDELMKNAKFDVCDEYPSKDDLRIWLEDRGGFKEAVSVEFAKTVPIIKLKSNRKKCDTGVNRSTSSYQDEGGGAVPTVSL